MGKIALAPVLLLVSALATGEQVCRDDIPSSAPDSRYTNNADGTILDLDTGLTWKRCSEGQTYTATNDGCDSVHSAFTWEEALQYVQDINAGTAGNNFGLTDWRLPNIKELSSLLEIACHDPGLNESVFPSTYSTSYWSATPCALGRTDIDEDFAWIIDTGVTVSGISRRYLDHSVRLVRGPAD